MSPSTSSSTRSWRSWLDLFSSLAMLAAASFIIYGFFVGPPRQSAQTAIAPPADPVPLTWAATLGKPDAKVGLLVFSDFQCPYCKRFALEALSSIRKTYVDSGKLLLAFGHLPLTTIHPHAMGAATASECAGRQDAFWPMHDQLFSANAGLEGAALKGYAATIGLDTAAFQACLTEKSPAIEQSMSVAEKIGIKGTPTIFVGSVEQGRLKVTAVLRGAQPFDDFKREIDKVLQQ